MKANTLVSPSSVEEPAVERKMKTEQELRDEIESRYQDIRRLHDEYKAGRLSLRCFYANVESHADFISMYKFILGDKFDWSELRLITGVFY